MGSGDAPLPKSRHLELSQAAQFWRQFLVNYYFETKGQVLKGVVIDYREVGPLDDPIPEVVLQTKDGRRYKVLASQERLKALLADAVPARGDWLKITYQGESDKAPRGMSKTKLFDLEVFRVESPPPSQGAGFGEVPVSDKGAGAKTTKGGS